MAETVPKDRRILSLAAKQYGHVTRHQLIDLGLTQTEIDKRLVKGLLIPVFQGVYAVGHPRPEAIARAAAAVLACGDEAVLSYFSAAALWGMGTKWPRIPRSRSPPGGAHRASGSMFTPPSKAGTSAAIGPSGSRAPPGRSSTSRPCSRNPS